MDKERFDRGLVARKAVLGDAYVDQAFASADDFNRDFQDLVTEYCWGTCWGEDTLDKRQRSLLNLGMIAALNRMHEWELHFKGAIANGLTAIYPWESPGGWHLLGRCPVPLFDATREAPALLAAGDRVRFTPVSVDEFARLDAELKAGRCDPQQWCSSAGEGV